MTADLSMTMGALGARGRVLDGSNPSGIGLTLRSDAMWTRTRTGTTEGMVESEGEASRLRVTAQGERVFTLGDTATLTPTAEIGLRVDLGDAETGAGLELGAGLRYAQGPLTLEGSVRGLAAHEASGYEEWGASGAIRIAPSPSGRGLSLRLAPTWGAAGSRTSDLWSATDPRTLAPGTDFEAEQRLEAEIGYGLKVQRTPGIVTPYTGLSLGGAGSRTWRTGTRWQLAPEATMGLEATRNAGAGEEPSTNAIEFRTEVRW